MKRVRKGKVKDTERYSRCGSEEGGLIAPGPHGAWKSSADYWREFCGREDIVERTHFSRNYV